MTTSRPTRAGFQTGRNTSFCEVEKAPGRMNGFAGREGAAWRKVLNQEFSYAEDVEPDRPTMSKMLTVEAQRILKMDPRSKIATRSSRILRASSCHTCRSGRGSCWRR